MTIVTRSAAVVLLAAAAAIALGQAGGQPSAPAPGAEPPSAAARLAAAEKACMFLHDLADGSPIAHQTVEHSYLWSLRRFEAQRDVEFAKDRGEAAARRHLEHVKALHDKIAGANAKGAFSKFDVAATQYYVAEAEELLAKARAK
ncbi:MAG: hypothetical protein K2Y21_03905 [Phycisphaerales bacterium]|jgi:hypothetical protein|nr:hypothetical protein [Phycisphaerales bacterium]